MVNKIIEYINGFSRKWFNLRLFGHYSVYWQELFVGTVYHPLEGKERGGSPKRGINYEYKVFISPFVALPVSGSLLLSLYCFIMGLVVGNLVPLIISLIMNKQGSIGRW